MNKKQLMQEFENNGWVVIPEVFDKSKIDTVIEEFNSTKHIYNFYQDKRGIGSETANSSHHTHITVPSMWSLIDNDVVEYVVTEAFQGPAIINTMGLSEVTNQGVYTQKIHRDVRTNTGDFRLYLNTLVMLDDSTEENGATWIMPKSQNCDTAPAEGLFFQESKRATGKKGDLLVFDCNLWHCAGRNNTPLPRRIITAFFSRPFIKQQIDIPRLYGEGFDECLTPRVSQFMGYNSRVPTSLGEFYQKSENRFYQSNQG